MSTPSTAKTDTIKQRSYSTPEHDSLQLWLFNEENQKMVAEYCGMPQVNESDDSVMWEAYESTYYATQHLRRFTTIEQSPLSINDRHFEYPLYTGYNNNYLLGVVDCILRARQEFIVDVEIRYIDGKPLNQAKIERHKISTNIRLLFEIKPKLNSISSVISQINIYKKPLVKSREELERFRAVILTTDTETKFDKFLLSEGIRVYRVPKEELI